MNKSFIILERDPIKYITNVTRAYKELELHTKTQKLKMMYPTVFQIFATLKSIHLLLGSVFIELSVKKEQTHWIHSWIPTRPHHFILFMVHTISALCIFLSKIRGDATGFDSDVRIPGQMRGGNQIAPLCLRTSSAFSTQLSTHYHSRPNPWNASPSVCTGHVDTLRLAGTYPAAEDVFCCLSQLRKKLGVFGCGEIWLVH